MRIRNAFLLLILLLLISACVSPFPSAEKKNWENLRASSEFQNEKKLYRERMDGREVCWGTGINKFLSSTDIKPARECIYPSSEMMVDLDDGLIVQNRVLTQPIRQLRVSQVITDGFIVTSPNFRNSQIVFIRKTDEMGIVDGSYLDGSNWIFYEYSGPYTYTSLVGTRTVHSFKKITNAKLQNAVNGLRVYAPSVELYINNELWDQLEPLKRLLAK